MRGVECQRDESFFGKQHRVKSGSLLLDAAAGVHSDYRGIFFAGLVIARQVEILRNYLVRNEELNSLIQLLTPHS